ncbi:glycoside hydrolase family 99-like domain-containing protein [Pseudoxanthomonas japonensis]|uniref:glycoside hydrolase family 99-like domain-containing protein n=1 Tax=Pseudoxanthomonas japonensis TaxID=69284 RepID=UPI003749F80D
MSNSLSRRLRTTLFYALRTAFRLTPMPQRTRDRMRERFLDTKGHWVPEGPRGQAPSGDLPRRPYVRSDERAIGYVPYEKGELPDPLPVTLVAFYLPQFHTIPENDEWWGKGFTEWRNVTRALPQFEGHYQPKLPGDLGFYDLRNVEVMHEQARLAREYGISAFCFYFYWFGGKTLLETPLRNWLNDKTIDLKFCLCWANEKWTRTWDGRGDEILIDQQHSPEDDIAFIAHVAEYMRDPRYLRLEGKPMLVVYRPGVMADMESTSARWRAWCRENGIGEIHVSYVQSFEKPHPDEIGANSAIQFPPNAFTASPVSDRQRLINPLYNGSILDWRDIAHQKNPEERYSLIPCVNPSWDNEARRPGVGRTFLHASPHAYHDWLVSAARTHSSGKDNHRLVFINAWNEWAEGAYLEPDSRWGYAYLNATRDALNKASGEHGHCMGMRTAIAVHAWYMPELSQLARSVRSAALDAPIYVTCAIEHHDEVLRAFARVGLHDIHVTTVDNRGRDVLPFLATAARLIGQGYDWVLKLHTKRSPHLADGYRWREELTEGLLASPHELIAALARNVKHGVVVADGHLLPLHDYLGANEAAVRSLVLRMGGNPDEALALDRFPSGSMYWLRLEALRPLLDVGITESDFEVERNQLDGTFAHAIERIIGCSGRLAGFESTSMSGLLEGRSLDQGDIYPYARKHT